MSNIPDFVLQIQEVERNLKAQWQLVQQDWRDNTADNFHRNIIEPYMQNFTRYITGNGLTGYGVDKLLQQMDNHLQRMSRLTGISENVAFSCAAGPQYNGKLKNHFGGDIDVEHNPRVMQRGGVVHNEQRDRDYWNDDRHLFDNDGVKPGELQNEDIKNIINQKK